MTVVTPVLSEYRDPQITVVAVVSFAPYLHQRFPPDKQTFQSAVLLNGTGRVNAHLYSPRLLVSNFIHSSYVSSLLWRCKTPYVCLSDCCWWGAVSPVMTAHQKARAAVLQPGGCFLARHTTSWSLAMKMMSVWWGHYMCLHANVGVWNAHPLSSILFVRIRRGVLSGSPASDYFPGMQMKR